MLKRDHIFLSENLFARNVAGTENIADCPNCGHLNRLHGFNEDVGLVAGKMTCVKYLKCENCGQCLCLPGEYPPTPAGQETGVFKAPETEQEATRKEQERRQRKGRAHYFERTLDTRTHIERERVKKAIETRVRSWATDLGITGPRLHALRHEILGTMHYGVGPNLEPIEPVLRTVGDVKRKLDDILRETIVRQPAFERGREVAARAYANIARDDAY